MTITFSVPNADQYPDVTFTFSTGTTQDGRGWGDPTPVAAVVPPAPSNDPAGATLSL